MLNKEIDWSTKTQEEREQEVLRLAKIRHDAAFNNVLKDIGKRFFDRPSPINPQEVLQHIILEEDWDLLITPYQNMIFIEVVHNGVKLKRYTFNTVNLLNQVLIEDILPE